MRSSACPRFVGDLAWAVMADEGPRPREIKLSSLFNQERERSDKGVVVVARLLPPTLTGVMVAKIEPPPPPPCHSSLSLSLSSLKSKEGSILGGGDPLPATAAHAATSRKRTVAGIKPCPVLLIHCFLSILI
ncbi:hypothetical protein CRG98_039834 [Punica granatum]|uniref:Uncharacterized protein n=1 Tax=Punica granatum TaxID=22663 RepID=A0A2I0I707_PUNGR|nr:hypothetical protein CRG98_039834 [Punica granatum]